MIISGGEDCKYKVWDSFGRQIYSSGANDHPITSLSWAPGGDVFAVGSFNMLRLCDQVGWSHSLEKPNTGSIYSLAWSADGTQLAGACSNGNLIFAHIIERRIEWKNYEVTLSRRKTITVRDVLNELIEKLDFPERVTKMALAHNHLVVTTSSQCHIFSTSNWNTPIIFDLKESFVSMIALSYRLGFGFNKIFGLYLIINFSFRHFLLVERSSMNLYSYDGKVLCSPKIPGMQIDALDFSGLSLSPDTLAVLDQNDDKSK